MIQRDKVQKETAMKEEDALINERDGESPQAAATPSKDRDAKKRPKKEVADLGFEDEALQVEDLEPPGVAAAKVGSRTRTQVHSGYFRPTVRMHVKQKLRVTCKGEFVAFVTAVMRIRMQQLPTISAQHCWELLRPCWQCCAYRCNNSQQSWLNNAGSCCVRAVSGVHTDAPTPNNVGLTMLEVVAFVLAVVCIRLQQLPTMSAQHCWELLRSYWQRCAYGCNNSQQC